MLLIRARADTVVEATARLCAQDPEQILPYFILFFPAGEREQTLSHMDVAHITHSNASELSAPLFRQKDMHRTNTDVPWPFLL